MPERLTIEISPNREIRVGCGLAVRGRKRSDGCCPADSPLEASEVGLGVSPLDISLEFQRDNDGHNEGSEIGHAGSGGSGLKPGWGVLPKLSRFGTPQKRLMLRAGAVCDRMFPGQQIILTGTLPGNTNEANYALAAWSGYIMNRLLQWVRRIVDENWTFGVWEWQKRGALHCHIAVCYRLPGQAEKIKTGFKEQWIKILRDVSDKEGIDLFNSGRGFSRRNISRNIQADAQYVKRSCAAYFAKYATKGYQEACDLELKRRKLFPFCPSRWIVVSRAVSRAIKEQTFKYVIEGPRASIGRKFEEILHKLEEMCCKQFAYKWKMIDGQTKVFYFEGEDFEYCREQLIAGRGEFKMQDDCKPVAKKKLKALPTQAWARAKYERHYGDPRVSWKANLCGAYLLGNLTPDGEREFWKLWGQVFDMG